MRVATICLLLAAAACSEDEESWRGAWDEPAGDVVTLRVVTFGPGSVHVTTAARETIRVEAEAEPSESAEPPVAVELADGILKVTSSPRTDGVCRIKVTAPPGLGLDVVAPSASVELAGAWAGILVNTTSADVSVRADRVAGGRVRTRTGAIDFETGTAPTAELSCTSDRGDVSLRVPASFRGSVHVSGAQGRITVGEHPRLRQTWDPDERNVKCWAGDVPTEAEIRAAGEMWRDPPGIWVKSLLGAAAFRLVD